MAVRHIMSELLYDPAAEPLGLLIFLLVIDCSDLVFQAHYFAYKVEESGSELLSTLCEDSQIGSVRVNREGQKAQLELQTLQNSEVGFTFSARWSG